MNCCSNTLRLFVRQPVRRVREPFDRQVINKFIEAVEQARRQRVVGLAPQHQRRHPDPKMRRIEPQRERPGSGVGGCSGEAR